MEARRWTDQRNGGDEGVGGGEGEEGAVLPRRRLVDVLPPSPERRVARGDEDRGGGGGGGDQLPHLSLSLTLLAFSHFLWGETEREREEKHKRNWREGGKNVGPRDSVRGQDWYILCVGRWWGRRILGVCVYRG